MANTETVVNKIPTCDVCGDGKTLAWADAKLKAGPWANVCHTCFCYLGCKGSRGRWGHPSGWPFSICGG